MLTDQRWQQYGRCSAMAWPANRCLQKTTTSAMWL